jgi:hypothetical protein
MLSVHGKNNRLIGQLRDRLKTTGMGLGLVRLQMDVGRTEDARTTLASLQLFIQRQAHRQARLSHHHSVPRAAREPGPLDLDRRLVADLFPVGLPEEKGC